MAEDGLMEQLSSFLGSEEGIRQLQNAARMLGLGAPEQRTPDPSAGLQGLIGQPGLTSQPGLSGIDGMDPQMMVKMVQLMQAARQETPSSAFLRALKPLLKEERRGRVDDAIRMMQLFSILPMLKEMG